MCKMSYVWKKSKLTKGIKGYDANALYIYCSGDVMHCVKDTLVVNKKQSDQKRIGIFCQDVLKGNCLGFAEVDIEETDKIYDNFSEIASLFVVQETPNCNILEEIKVSKERSGRKEQSKEQKSYWML